MAPTFYSSRGYAWYTPLAAVLEVRLECGWAPHGITDVHEESLEVVGAALADQSEGPGAVQVISQGLDVDRLVRRATRSSSDLAGAGCWQVSAKSHMQFK